MANNEKEKKGKLTKDEVKNLVDMLKHLMGAYGFFAEKLGEIQRTHEEAFERMFSPESIMQLPETLSKIAEKAPELSELFTKIYIKMFTYLPQINNLMNLSADDKIKLGKNLKSLAKDMDELLDYVNKVK